MVWLRLALAWCQGLWIRFHGRYLCRHRRLRDWRASDALFCLRCGRSWKRDKTNPNVLEVGK